MSFSDVKEHFYPTAFNGYVGIVFSHGIRVGERLVSLVGVRVGLSGMYLRNHKA